MFHHFFINTRSSIDYVHKQLRFLARVISLTTQVLFIGYYIYLLVINVNKTAFLITYAFLLALSCIGLMFDIIYFVRKGQTRLEKRLTLEKKRKLTIFIIIIRIILLITVIVLSGITLVKYPASDMQIITFTLSIVLLIFYLVFNTLIFFINKDIDLIRLSIDSDISSSMILSKLLHKGKQEYTEQEERLLEEIEERAKGYSDK